MEWKERTKKKAFDYTGYIIESFKIYNSHQGFKSISSDCKIDGIASRYAELWKLSESIKQIVSYNCFIYAATRQNMNRLMTCEQWEHLRNRNIIESDWGVLKQNYFLEYHQARCMDGLFRHYVSCISAYILECRLKSYPKIKTRI